MQCLSLRLAVFLVLGLAGLVVAVSPPPKPDPVSADHARLMAQSRELFGKSVRGILADNCLKCHGGDKTRAEFSLATREALLKGGENGTVLVPGKGKGSKLYRLAAHHEEPHMPPKDNKRLTAAQLADLARWIDLGAAYDKPLIDRPETPKTKAMVVSAADRDFWSFRPLARPRIPEVKAAHWAINPVDRFVLAKMEEKKLAPTPHAGRRTLIRRAYFGLVGLPPSPEAVAAYLADTRPDAYERLVDELLASPAHGERWGRHWLDVVRFAESHGFEHDYDRPHAYPYRDFVLKALNDDLPYDTFTRWQLAGDEFAPKDPLALTATGFLGAGVHSTQITANTVEKERYDELDDIVRTMGTAMLGLTVGCARCHDHKYDPIPVKDYYRLVSTFTKTVRSDADIAIDDGRAEEVRRQHALDLAGKWAELVQYEQGPLAKKFKGWLASIKKETFTAWTVVEPTNIVSAGGATFTNQPDGSRLASGKNADSDTYTVTLTTKAEGIHAIRLEALAHPSMTKGGPGRAGNGNFALSDVKISIAPQGGKAVPVKIRKARATFEQTGLPVAASIDADPRSAWAIDPQFGKDHAAVFDLEKPIGHAGGSVLTIVLKFTNNAGHNIGRPRFSLSTKETPPAVAGDGIPEEVRAALLQILATDSKSTKAEDEILARYHRTQDAEWRKLSAQVEALRKGPKLPTMKAMICGEGLTPLRLHTQGGDFLNETHFLERGDANQKKGIASQGFLQVLMRDGATEKRWQETPPTGATTPYQRRSLANWMTDAEKGGGHLLARVIVNRLWQHHFGRGLVATPSDFGLQGDRPTHPELLDYLAGELIRNEWRLKPIHRLIMTSAAYRQGTATNAEHVAIDPDNKFLWRKSPQRLEAEVIRDSLLSVAGQLDRRMFGAGSLDPNMKRRSVYFFMKRSQLIPMMTLFDAPDGTVGIEARTNTTIAPQALLLMNNPVVRTASRAFAGRLAGMSDADAVKAGYSIAVGRQPATQELADSVAFLAAQRSAYQAEKKADAVELALLDFCQVLLGLNEFVYVD